MTDADCTPGREPCSVAASNDDDDDDGILCVQRCIWVKRRRHLVCNTSADNKQWQTVVSVLGEVVGGHGESQEYLGNQKVGVNTIC